MTVIDRSKFKPARERVPQISEMAANGHTSDEIAAALGDISPRRVRAIAERFGIRVAKRGGARHFGFYTATSRAEIISELARVAEVSPSTMCERLVRIGLDGGVEQARKRLGTLAIAAKTYNKAPKP